ncbi:ABC transporter permease [Dyadobacter sp. CY323]|uniref:ABC transporter permease n=1 Tax=Dyadobacter sp. CY323 TaxID=2907302 RepID=UPI001F3E476C|nr:ABC transporter permease [Dyadobacter sp. CY323]MCE6992423.1 ABC transporter permease [Dyadobacter sp. CY323]
MLPTYLKISFRNLLKERQFTVLNLIGLSTGLACTFLIYLWINDELHVDKYNAKDTQLYQVMANHKNQDGIKTITHTAGLLADALAAEMPEVEHAVTVLPASWFSNSGTVSFGNTHLKTGEQFVGKEYFNVFSCPIVEGDRNSLFRDNQTIGISDEMALKLFSTTENVIGKTVKWEKDEFSGLYHIGHVFKKNPANAVERFDLLFNFALYAEKRPGMKEWGNSDPSTYLILKKGTDVAALNDKLKNFLLTKQKSLDVELFAIKFSDKYLDGQFENGVQAGGRIVYVKLFGIIALFILLVACINFMNLSTARASGRMKEVGVKKTLGAGRKSLVTQYLSESVLMAFLSLVIAILFVLLLLPQFNNLTGKQIDLQLDPTMLVYILTITFATGLIAGSYPAFYLSGFNAISVLKGTLRTSVSELLVRKGLVVFQFAISMIFIVSVLVVYKQIEFIQSKNLGYNRDNIIHFEIPMETDLVSLKSSEAFLNELKNVPGVVSAASYGHNLTGVHGSISGFEWPGRPPGKDIDFANLEVGFNFIETFGIQLKEGRSFSQNQNAGNEIVFNESAIKAMGLKDPIGKTVKFWGRERQIVGVVKDFNFESLYENVKPCFFQVYPVVPNIMLKIQGGAEPQTIARVEKAFKEHYQGNAFEYEFMDENYKALYASERRISVLSRYFAGLAVLISCLGLFGLAAFTAQRRQKEIGIRKVVGATISNVVVMLSADFLKLIVIAMVIAFPLIGWAMDQWLHEFAYRIDLHISIFIYSGLAIATLALGTVGYQAVKAAVMDPVKSLRSE